LEIKNIRMNDNIKALDLTFYDAENKPFRIHGVYRYGEKLIRLPKEVAEKCNPGVVFHHDNSAGGRVRFITDSMHIAISADMEVKEDSPHFSVMAMCGFDMYEKKENGEHIFVSSFVPPRDVKDGYSGVISFEEKRLREITINMPSYNDVYKLYIGLDKDAVLKEAPDYKYKTPIVYYGSSITQGSSASRPGMSYENIITRRLDTEYINLGFSGSAKAEEAISEYIRNLDMSIFVYDYDHNAPTIEHLENTHERMFKEFRSKNPTTPVIMMTRPNFVQNEDMKKRVEIVIKTYNNALNSGDKNVYFINGKDLMKYCGNEGTAENTHPNDFGFYSMGKVLGDLIEEILNK